MGHAHEEEGLTVYIGATARGNPGLTGAGIVICNAGGEELLRAARYLGGGAVLEAHLGALMLALRYARPYAPRALALIMGNETMIRQLGEGHPARHPRILAAQPELEALCRPFQRITYHLGDEALHDAAHLADLAIDTRLGPLPIYDIPLPS